MTFRAVVLGLSIVVLTNLWVTYAGAVVISSRFNLSYFQLTLLAPFIILVGAVNPLLKVVRRRLAFSASELLTVVAIGIVGSVVPGSGITGFFIGIISSPYYFATPENGWADFYHPHLGAWMVPTDREALRLFYEGLPPGVPAPWQAWLIPLAWWGSLIAAILVGIACLMVILREQWVEHEKLVYPLVAVPVEMVEDANSERLLPGFMQGKLFWGPAVLAFGLFAWKSLSWFLPAIPDITVIPSGGLLRFTQHSPALILQPLQFYTLGFAFFSSLEVLFSVWFFSWCTWWRETSSTGWDTRSSSLRTLSRRIRRSRRGNVLVRWPVWSCGGCGSPGTT